MCSVPFVLLPYVAMHPSMCVSSGCLEAKSSLSEGDKAQKDQDTLPELISAHATSTVLPALLVTPPPPLPFTLSQFLDQDLDAKMLHGTFDPLIPLSFPHLPSC